MDLVFRWWVTRAGQVALWIVNVVAATALQEELIIGVVLIQVIVFGVRSAILGSLLWATFAAFLCCWVPFVGIQAVMNLLDSIGHLLASTHVIVFIIHRILTKLLLLLSTAAIAYKAIFLHLDDGLLVTLILHYAALLLGFCLLYLLG